MSYFSQDFIDFFKELEVNNDRDWFTENKKRYENSVKKPFAKFIDDLIIAFQDIYPNLTMTSKESIFRIYRDVRFSQDKKPYKNHSAAIVSEHGKKNMTMPSLYVQANHVDFSIYSGCYQLEKDNLKSVRFHIAENIEEFKALYADNRFQEVFGEIQGEKNKRLPTDFMEAANKEPLIFNKSFYYFKKLPAETILDDSLISIIHKNYEAALPLNHFFEEALGK